MTVAVAETAPRDRAKPQIRVVYRSGAGQTDLDWPVERIAEALSDPDGTLWVDIEGTDACFGAIEALLRDVFHFHPLAIEDALREANIPKLDDWGDYLYAVFQGLDFATGSEDLLFHELDVFLGRNYLVTYHYDPMPIVAQLRGFLERDGGIRLQRGADHLLCNLLDMGVDEHINAIEHLDEIIDAAQEEVFSNPTPQTLHTILHVKRSALRIYRLIAPQREILNRLARDPYVQIDEPDRVYFRDVYDHLVRFHDVTESLRDLIGSALDTYLSAVSNRTNDVMKTLTIVTVMFLPMSFLAGFFGMNFFGGDLEIHPMMPRALLFWGSLVMMFLTPAALWMWLRQRGWF